MSNPSICLAPPCAAANSRSVARTMDYEIGKKWSKFIEKKSTKIIAFDL